MPHALPLYRADAVRAIERAAFARGVDAFGLMTQAGEAAAALLRQRWPDARRFILEKMRAYSARLEQIAVLQAQGKAA